MVVVHPEPVPSASHLLGLPPRLVGFDLDGTLITGTTTLLHVGAKIGHRRATLRLVDGYESYRLSNREVTDAAAALFAGRTEQELASMMVDCARVDQIEETVASLVGRGIETLIATITFRFASQYFADLYGFSAYDGVRLISDADGVLTGEVARHVTEADKRQFLATQASKRGVRMDEVAFVGDSRSDLPCFDAVGYSIALNPSAEAARTADRTLRTADLRDVLPVLNDLGIAKADPMVQIMS